jgi:hypothetical protein
MDEYYYGDKDRKPQGPHNASEIRELLKEGQLTAASLIWRPGDASWQELQKLPEFPLIQGEPQKCDHENSIISKALKEELPTPDEKPQVVAATQTAEDKQKSRKRSKTKRIENLPVINYFVSSEKI